MTHRSHWIYIQKNWKQDLRYLHTHIHHSTIHDSQAGGATQMSTNKWMDEDVVHVHYAVLK